MWGLVINRSRDITRQVSTHRSTRQASSAPTTRHPAAAPGVLPCGSCVSHQLPTSRVQPAACTSAPAQVLQLKCFRATPLAAVAVPALPAMQALGYIPASQPDLQAMFCRWVVAFRCVGGCLAAWLGRGGAAAVAAPNGEERFPLPSLLLPLDAPLCVPSLSCPPPSPPACSLSSPPPPTPPPLQPLPHVPAA